MDEFKIFVDQDFHQKKTSSVNSPPYFILTWLEIEFLESSQVVRNNLLVEKRGNKRLTQARKNSQKII